MTALEKLHAQDASLSTDNPVGVRTLLLRDAIFELEARLDAHRDSLSRLNQKAFPPGEQLAAEPQSFSRLAEIEAKVESLIVDMLALKRDHSEIGFSFLSGQHEALRIELFGDAKRKAAYEQAKRTGTFPNFPLPTGEKFEEPPPGAIEQAINALRDEFRQALTTVQHDVADLRNTNTKVVELMERTQAQLAFVKRLEAFFGPMLEGKNPPLDGAQVASKEYVDAAIARFAGVINAKVVDAIEFFSRLSKNTLGMADATDDSIAIDAKAAPLERFRKRLEVMWARERRAIESEHAGRDRLRSLYHAITGKTGGRS